MKLEEWQTGLECKINYLDRIEKMNKWLKDNKENILSADTKIESTEVVIGFVDL